VSTGIDEGTAGTGGTGTAATRQGKHHRSKPRKPVRHTHTALVLAAGFVVWLFIGLVPLHLLHNLAMAPGWFLLGAALVPLTLLWIMAHRLTPADTITAEKLVQTAAIGGLLAFTLGGTLDALSSFIPQETVEGLGVTSLALAGVIEEFSKAVLIVVLGWKVAKTTRNGLFLGGAVGIGFALLETTYYIWDAFATGAPSPLLAASEIVFRRGLLSPLMHPLWSSLLGAALFYAASESGRFRLTLGVLGAYLGVAVLHGVWDSAGPIIAIALGTPDLVNLIGYACILVAALVGGFVWRHVARKAAAPVEPLPAPGA
jgi:RsiW-degrading membrane proteinase PrsW (M82 family)